MKAAVPCVVLESPRFAGKFADAGGWSMVLARGFAKEDFVFLKPAFGFIHPDWGITHPDWGIAKPALGFVHPNEGCANPDSREAHPHEGFTDLQATFSNPDAGWARPSFSCRGLGSRSLAAKSAFDFPHFESRFMERR